MFLLLYLAKLEAARVTENIVKMFVLDIIMGINGVFVQILITVRLIIGCHYQSLIRRVKSNEID